MAGKKYGLDFGTNNIRIFQSGQGLVIDEKNMIAIQRKKDIVAIGDAAYEMYERTPDTIVIHRPVNEGVIADINNLGKLVPGLLKKAGGTTGFVRNNGFYVAVPYDISEVEKMSYFGFIAHSSFNTHNIFSVDKPLAAAVGSGLTINSSRGMMIVDMGAGTTEISVISSGGIVVSKLIRMGGNTINNNIRRLVRQEHQLIIGDKTAEYLKLELGRATPGNTGSAYAYGRDQISGLPSKAQVDASLVFDAMNSYLSTVLDTITYMLDVVPPHMADEVVDRGIYFTGGSIRIPELEQLFKASIRMPIHFQSDSTGAVAKGLGIIMENTAEYKDILFSMKDAMFN